MFKIILVFIIKMEYATKICGEVCNDNFMKHVGYSDHMCDDSCGPSCMRRFYAQSNINKMSCKITELLTGVNKDNRPIIVPDKTICSVMSAVYQSFRPETGDIHSRYIVPKAREENYVHRMIDEVINIITTNVKDSLGMEECNRNLSIWTTVLGDFNAHGLQSHPKIKLRENRPMPMMFNMNY
jgi:hypothetical protein